MVSGTNQSSPGVRTKGSVPDVRCERVPELLREENSLGIRSTTSRAPDIMALGTVRGLGAGAHAALTVFGVNH